MCKSDIERHPEFISGSHNKCLQILKQVQNDGYMYFWTPYFFANIFRKPNNITTLAHVTTYQLRSDDA